MKSRLTHHKFAMFCTRATASINDYIQETIITSLVFTDCVPLLSGWRYQDSFLITYKTIFSDRICCKWTWFLLFLWHSRTGSL